MQTQRGESLAGPRLSFLWVLLNTKQRGQSAESDVRQVLTQFIARADPEAVVAVDATCNSLGRREMP